MSEKIEAKVTHLFAQPPEAIYDLLLDPARTRLWHEAWLRRAALPAEITRSELDPGVGGNFRLSDRRSDGEANHWGTFRALERPRKVEFTWIVDPGEEDDPAIVTLIIEPEPDGGGSVVTLYNSMDAQWSEWIERTERGWRNFLLGLEDALRA